MSTLTLEGKIVRIFDAQQVSASFKKREFVIETADEYPQLVKFELVQDKCSLIDKYQLNQDVTVHFNVRGREWNEKFFTNLNAWRITTNQSTDTISSSELDETRDHLNSFEVVDAKVDNGDDGLPF